MAQAKGQKFARENLKNPKLDKIMKTSRRKAIQTAAATTAALTLPKELLSSQSSQKSTIPPKKAESEKINNQPIKPAPERKLLIAITAGTPQQPATQEEIDLVVHHTSEAIRSMRIFMPVYADKLYDRINAQTLQTLLNCYLTNFIPQPKPDLYTWDAPTSINLLDPQKHRYKCQLFPHEETPKLYVQVRHKVLAPNYEDSVKIAENCRQTIMEGDPLIVASHNWNVTLEHIPFDSVTVKMTEKHDDSIANPEKARTVTSQYDWKKA